MPHMAHARTRRDAAPGLAVFSPAASLVATADAISSTTALPARTPADEASLGPEPSPDNATHRSRPRCAARCSGVLRQTLAARTLAPASSSSRATTAWP